jgi:cell division protein FtsB
LNPDVQNQTQDAAAKQCSELTSELATTRKEKDKMEAEVTALRDAASRSDEKLAAIKEQVRFFFHFKLARDQGPMARGPH